MALLTKITKTSGSYQAVFANGKGAMSESDISTLCDDGLPGIDKESADVQIDFKSLLPSSEAEYAAAFTYPSDAMQGHAVWCCHTKEHRIVVPALALIRALVLPSRRIFPFLFRPQSLEDVCVYDVDAQCIEFLRKGVLGRRYGEDARDNALKGIFQWMYTHPSAREMWGSVYAHASHGRLALTLPDAVVKATILGATDGRNFYVTRVLITEVSTAEAPYEFASGQPSVFKKDRRQDAQGHNKVQIALRRAPDGRTALSDSEWAAVKSILSEGSIRNVYPTVRTVIDAISHKTSHGGTYQQALAGTEVKPQSLSYYLATWRKDGRWTRIQDWLNATRC